MFCKGHLVTFGLYLVYFLLISDACMQIPFNITRSEIVALFGRNVNLVRDIEEPVHIIMCKVTSKTHDAFVEFDTYENAVEAQEKLMNSSTRTRAARLGERNIETEVSSQAALMQALFPMARGLRWEGSDPVMKDHNPRFPFENFNGFVSKEEMMMMVKHVEVPQRVSVLFLFIISAFYYPPSPPNL